MKARRRPTPPHKLLIVDHNKRAKLARLRGPQADRVATRLPCDFRPARGGIGWITGAENLPDVYAWAQLNGLIVRTITIGDKP
jgi:hypothetical protein